MIGNQVCKEGNSKYECPVCGYLGLRELPYDVHGNGSDEICVCCGFQFGYDDYPDKEQSFKFWRKEWKQNGYQWFSKKTKPPTKWNPLEQIRWDENE